MIRARLELAAAGLLALLAMVTATWPDWIEILSGDDPDGGSGTTEWLVVVLLAVAGLGCALWARRDFAVAARRRAQQAPTV